MAALVRFEQDPDAPEGAGVFHFDSGAQQYAYEPDLAAQASLDAAPDQRVAGPGGGSWLDEPPDPSMFQQADAQGLRQQLTPAGGNAHASAAPAGLAGMAARPMPQAAPPPQGPPPVGPPPMLMAPSGSPSLAAQARDAMGQRAAQDILRGTKRVHVAGSPGVDPHRMLEQGVMVPTGTNVTQESGAPYSPEQATERIMAAKDVRDAQLGEMELQQQQTANQLASQRAIAPQLEREAALQQENHNRMVSSYRVDRSRLQQELDDYDKNAHVNPDRFFQDRGTFATIGMAIAQGLGAYASTMTGAPNFAYEMVQKAIDRDIGAQRDELEAGRVSRRNKLAQMMDSYGFDMQQSEAALRIAMNKSAEMQAAMFANESKLPQYQAEAAKYNALSRQEIIKNEQALQNASYGKFTRSQQQAFVQPRAATGGGYVEKELTPQELEARAKLLPKDQSQDVADLEPKERLRIAADYGAKKADFASMRSSYDDLASAYGYKIDWNRKELVDPRTGKPVSPEESALFGKNANIPGVGSAPHLDRQGAHRVQESRAKAAAITGKALSGASVSPQQAEFIQSYLLGDDDAAALRGLQRAVSDMGQVETDTEAAYPEETRAEYDRRKRGINREHKQAPSPVKVNPY